MGFIPYAVSWNLTARCNLRCRHCYLDAGERSAAGPGELSPAEALGVVDQLAALNRELVLILTGGEPLLRPDLDDLIRYASGKGMMVVLGTNGTLLTIERARELRAAGLSGVGVSVDSLDPAVHDEFRGAPGALAQAMAGLAAARDAGLSVQAQMTPTTRTLGELPAIAAWARGAGAKAFNIFFLVCTGRGETMADITPEEYEGVLRWAAENRNAYPGMLIRPKCAPHFKRVLHANDPNDNLLKTYIAACRAGTHYMRIGPDGVVTPCPYMETPAGNIREGGLADLWNHSPVFARYRAPEYHGKCGQCQYRLLCGGCRARALATMGDDMGEDRWCVYKPQGEEAAIENVDTRAKFGGASGGAGLAWSAEATERLARIPFFAREIAREAVESYAREKGIAQITPEVMTKASPGRPPMFGQPNGAAPAPSPAPAAPESDIPWDDDAWARVQNAPEFVRRGIPKLMARRAKARGISRITSEFLSEIRDESMMLVTRRMKDFGFGEIDMGAWDASKEVFKKDAHRGEVIGKIRAFLDQRPEKNKAIIEKFGSFFSDNVGEKMGWTQEARERIERAPAMFRQMAVSSVESYARKRGFKYVTLEALEEAMAKSPFGAFGRKPS